MTSATHDMDPQSETYGLPITSEPESLSATPSPDPLNEIGTKGKDGGTLDLEEHTRQAHLKFPPRNSGLKIPRSLLLYSPQLSSANSDPSVKLTRAEKAQQMRDEVQEICPKNQAMDMTHLMRRSIELHEFADRVMWDDDLDPDSAARERVQIQEVSDDEKEEKVVRGWIEDTLASV